MYKRDFEIELKKQKIDNFWLIRGNDEFLNEFYANELKNKFKAENFLSFYYNEYNYDVGAEFLGEPSLFGGDNLLHIKTNKTLPTKEIKNYIEICKKYPNNFFIYELNEDGNYKLNADFFKIFGTNFVRFFKPTNWREAEDILIKLCNNLKINSTSAALERIYKIHNENLNLSANEIKKFASLNLELNLQNIQDMVFGLSEISYEEFFYKLILLENVREKYFLLTKSDGFNETEFLNYMFREFYKLFQIYVKIRINPVLDFKEIFGFNPPIHIQNRLKMASMKFNKENYKTIFIFLNELDFDLKHKNCDKTTFLLSKILKLQMIISKFKSKN